MPNYFGRSDYVDPRTWRHRLRRRRMRMVERLVRHVLAHKPTATIVDLGGRESYWELLDRELAPQVHITLVNIEAQPSGKRASHLQAQIDFHLGDACAMPELGDRSFDIAHSNSVIEHVGSLSRMAHFADETKRVGNAYYVQTPYLWFPVDPHYGVPFFHWLPGPTRAKMLHRFKAGYASRAACFRSALEQADDIEMLDKTMMRNLFDDGVMVCERVMLLTKSISVFRDASFPSYQ